MDRDSASGEAAHDPGADRAESTAERLDRNWGELLQELRVTQTGIQMLGGFLLVLPFQSRFPELGSDLRLVYLVTFSSSVLSVFFILAPIMMHRLLFRTRRKDVIVRMSNRLAQIGLGLLALTMVGVVALVFGFVLGDMAAVISAAIAAIAAAVLLWGLAGYVALRHSPGSQYDVTSIED